MQYDFYMHLRTLVGESVQSEDGEKESRNCGNNIVHQGQGLSGDCGRVKR